MAERLKAPLSKSGILLTTGSWVRIPPSPPSAFRRDYNVWLHLVSWTATGPHERIPSFYPPGRRVWARTCTIECTCGEMSEMAEGARLEIVCAAKSGTEGSNPSLSATPSH